MNYLYLFIIIRISDNQIVILLNKILEGRFSPTLQDMVVKFSLLFRLRFFFLFRF